MSEPSALSNKCFPCPSSAPLGLADFGIGAGAESLWLTWASRSATFTGAVRELSQCLQVSIGSENEIPAFEALSSARINAISPRFAAPLATTD